LVERVEIQQVVDGAVPIAPREELIFYSWNRVDDPTGLFDGGLDRMV
jgi:hypothetical protein